MATITAAAAAAANAASHHHHHSQYHYPSASYSLAAAGSAMNAAIDGSAYSAAAAAAAAQGAYGTSSSMQHYNGSNPFHTFHNSAASGATTTSQDYATATSANYHNNQQQVQNASSSFAHQNQLSSHNNHHHHHHHHLSSTDTHNNHQQDFISAAYQQRMPAATTATTTDDLTTNNYHQHYATASGTYQPPEMELANSGNNTYTATSRQESSSPSAAAINQQAQLMRQTMSSTGSAASTNNLAPSPQGSTEINGGDGTANSNSGLEATKSTKGASKMRRDLINHEIAHLRDLLPLPASTRQRLSQLQLMALVLVYVRKSNYFNNEFKNYGILREAMNSTLSHLPTGLSLSGFSKSLNGFLMMLTQKGKLIYISDNAAEYLGHSMEDLLSHGDEVYDIIEDQDKKIIRNELLASPTTASGGAADSSAPVDCKPTLLANGKLQDTKSDESKTSRIALCRMNVSRNARRQMRFGDQKVVLIEGHYLGHLPLSSRDEPVFVATCTPIAMPETRECVVQGCTNVFTTIHSMDMKFLYIDHIGEHHLGYKRHQLAGLSWYELVHWDHLSEVQMRHKRITTGDQERSTIALLRLLCADSSKCLWVHSVMQVKEPSESGSQPVIVCTNQILSEREAQVMRNNPWLYQFYSMHSSHPAKQLIQSGAELQTADTPNSLFEQQQQQIHLDPELISGGGGSGSGDQLEGAAAILGANQATNEGQSGNTKQMMGQLEAICATTIISPVSNRSSSSTSSCNDSNSSFVSHASSTSPPTKLAGAQRKSSLTNSGSSRYHPYSQSAAAAAAAAAVAAAATAASSAASKVSQLHSGSVASSCSSASSTSSLVSSTSDNKSQLAGAYSVAAAAAAATAAAAIYSTSTASASGHQQHVQHDYHQAHYHHQQQHQQQQQHDVNGNSHNQQHQQHQPYNQSNQGNQQAAYQQAAWSYAANNPGASASYATPPYHNQQQNQQHHHDQLQYHQHQQHQQQSHQHNHALYNSQTHPHHHRSVLNGAFNSHHHHHPAYHAAAAVAAASVNRWIS